jgi:hypothetical protein
MMISSEPPVGDEAEKDLNVAPVAVVNILRMGPITQYHVRFETGDKAIVHSQYRSTGRIFWEGERAWLRWPATSCIGLKE